jgi:mono/diheme cytochrome c family protein
VRRASAALLVSLAAVMSGCGGAGQKPNARDVSAELTREVGGWVSAEKLPPGAVPGARQFVLSSCTTCHVYLGSGWSVSGSPDLTDAGSLGRGLGWQIRHLRCPACVVPGSSMPKYDTLGQKRLRQLAVFLEASKGKR